jgi:polyphosphate kinase
MSAPTRFFNRELSWLAFNRRVLNEARDPSVPLLERLKFLAITGSNLNEFFMVRVGGLQMLLAAGKRKPDPSGMTPGRQLGAIAGETRRMVEEQYACLARELEPGLREQGIARVRAADLTERQRRHLDAVFESEIYPVMTPMALDGARFPLLQNLALYVLVRLAPADGAPAGKARAALLPLGSGTPRFVRLPSEAGYAYMLLEDVVELYASRFFPEAAVLDYVPFRITRNADMAVREDMAADLLSGMEDVLAARRTSDCVRLEIDRRASRAAQAVLVRWLGVRRDALYRVAGPLALEDFMTVATLSGFDAMHYVPWPSHPSPAVDPRRGIFETVAEKDVLLYHPYESFDPVRRLVEEAADDPDVLAVKQILYRTSRNSPIVAALRRAAQNGKAVTALVELKARFDEARNIRWARDLETAGVQVIYGVKGYKTHAKLCIVVRREQRGIVRYLHFGTGNYNEVTARLYGDISYLTCDPELGADASTFFNMVAGYSQPQALRRLCAAPMSLRTEVLALIRGEIQRRRQGQKAAIRAKMNSLADPAIIEALYAASQAGVEIRLNIRGICCLRPGVPGLSETIEVTSIVDRYLEHARIFYFHQGGDPRVFISSADWMPRNLDKRIELMTPVDDPVCRKQVCRALDIHLADTERASVLQPDGAYVRRPAGRKRRRSQAELQDAAQKRAAAQQRNRRTVFEQHRPPEDDA